uniref:Uncharacterized protein n=1 Tax=Anguilla anguilla TaxID=7936 RepID=A0A0E9XBS9_ANGAN
MKGNKYTAMIILHSPYQLHLPTEICTLELL